MKHPRDMSKDELLTRVYELEGDNLIMQNCRNCDNVCDEERTEACENNAWDGWTIAKPKD